jgi:pyruvate/2-oxoglutarate dehydrogenase complex dihydrolipoamide acyltransferase (E2) component
MTEVRIPKMSMAVDEAVLAQWLIEDGATVHQGEPLYLLETEKVETEIEATATGVVRHLAVAGESYEAGALIARIDEPTG